MSCHQGYARGRPFNELTTRHFVSKLHAHYQFLPTTTHVRTMRMAFFTGAAKTPPISSCRRVASRRRAYRFARSRVARHTTSESNNEAPPPPPPPLSHLHRRIFCVFQMNRAPITDARPTRDAPNNRRALNNLRIVENNLRK